MAPKKPPPTDQPPAQKHKGKLSECIIHIIQRSIKERTPALYDFGKIDPQSPERFRDFVVERLRNREEDRTIASEASHLIENSMSVALECLYDQAEKVSSVQSIPRLDDMVLMNNRRSRKVVRH